MPNTPEYSQVLVVTCPKPLLPHYPSPPLTRGEGVLEEAVFRLFSDKGRGMSVLYNNLYDIAAEGSGPQFFTDIICEHPLKVKLITLIMKLDI